MGFPPSWMLSARPRIAIDPLPAVRQVGTPLFLFQFSVFSRSSVFPPVTMACRRVSVANPPLPHGPLLPS